MEIDKQIEFMGLALEQGDIDPLELAIIINAAEKAIKALKPKLRDSVLNRLGGTGCTIGSVKIVPMDGRPSYKYSHIEAWSEAKARAKAIEQLAKQATQEGVSTFDTETGEEIAPAEISYSANSYRIEKA